MNALELHDTIPYYCVKLTTEQVLLIKDKQMEIYTMDGKTLFPVMENDKQTGEYVFYVIFK